jgi:hypothetical protein
MDNQNSFDDFDNYNSGISYGGKGFKMPKAPKKMPKKAPRKAPRKVPKKGPKKGQKKGKPKEEQGGDEEKQQRTQSQNSNNSNNTTGPQTTNSKRSLKRQRQRQGDATMAQSMSSMFSTDDEWQEQPLPRTEYSQQEKAYSTSTYNNTNTSYLPYKKSMDLGTYVAPPANQSVQAVPAQNNKSSRFSSLFSSLIPQQSTGQSSQLTGQSSQQYDSELESESESELESEQSRQQPQPKPKPKPKPQPRQQPQQSGSTSFFEVTKYTAEQCEEKAYFKKNIFQKIGMIALPLTFPWRYLRVRLFIYLICFAYLMKYMLQIIKAEKKNTAVTFPKYSTMKKFLIMLIVVYYVLAILCFAVTMLMEKKIKGKGKIAVAILWFLTWAPVISALILIIVFYLTEK